MSIYNILLKNQILVVNHNVYQQFVVVLSFLFIVEKWKFAEPYLDYLL